MLPTAKVGNSGFYSGNVMGMLCQTGKEKGNWSSCLLVNLTFHLASGAFRQHLNSGKSVHINVFSIGGLLFGFVSELRIIICAFDSI